MSYLGVLLDQVKLKDLVAFKTKIETMEKGKAQLLQDSGLQNMDMVIRERQQEIETRLVDGERAYADLKIEKSNERIADQKPGGVDMFNKFIEVLKG